MFKVYLYSCVNIYLICNFFFVVVPSFFLVFGLLCFQLHVLHVLYKSQIHTTYTSTYYFIFRIIASSQLLTPDLMQVDHILKLKGAPTILMQSDTQCAQPEK